MSELKRKKHSHESDRPRKKIATEASKSAISDVKFNIISDNNDDWKPVVGMELTS